MADTVSKEMLKSALVELAETEREFFMSLISDTLAHALASTDSAIPIKNKQKQGIRKPLPARVNPAYRKGAETLMEGLAINKSALLDLRTLFADEPSAEEIIATLTK